MALWLWEVTILHTPPNSGLILLLRLTGGDKPWLWIKSCSAIVAMKQLQRKRQPSALLSHTENKPRKMIFRGQRARAGTSCFRAFPIQERRSIVPFVPPPSVNVWKSVRKGQQALQTWPTTKQWCCQDQTFHTEGTKWKKTSTRWARHRQKKNH